MIQEQEKPSNRASTVSIVTEKIESDQRVISSRCRTTRLYYGHFVAFASGRVLKSCVAKAVDYRG
eukprot:scaffold27149_cov46-Cyclotella_meneghiniana.AAC.2